jgi:hypothetical protein
VVDPSELKRNLEAMSDALAELPGCLSALAEAGEALRHSVDELGRDLRDRQAGAEKLFADAERAVVALDEAATEEAERLRQAGAELEAGLHHALLPLAFDGDVVSERFDLEALASAPAGLRAVEEEAEDAMAAVVAKLDAGHAALDTVRGILTDSEAVLVARLDTAHTGLTEAVDGIVRLMEAQQQDTLGRLDEMVQTLSGLQSLLEDELEEVAETVCRSAVQEALDETRDRAENVRQRIVSALGALEEEVRGVGGAMKSAREGSSTDRESLELLFQDLQARLEPMKRAIESIREEAEDVGLG